MNSRSVIHNDLLSLLKNLPNKNEDIMETIDLLERPDFEVTNDLKKMRKFFRTLFQYDELNTIANNKAITRFLNNHKIDFQPPTPFSKPPIQSRGR